MGVGLGWGANSLLCAPKSSKRPTITTTSCINPVFLNPNGFKIIVFIVNVKMMSVQCIFFATYSRMI